MQIVTVTEQLILQLRYWKKPSLRGSPRPKHTNKKWRQNNYYPFGLNHKGYNQVVNSNRSEAAEKYKFQGQELQDELGLNWYSFKWRNYMPDLGRFFGIDPLTTDYHWMTPYQFSSNQLTHAPEIEGMENGSDFAVNLKVAEQLSKRDNSDLIDNYRMVKKANELPIPDQASVMVLRYATPVEDVFGLITGRDLEGNSYNRAEAGAWTALSIFPVTKLGKVAKVGKLIDLSSDALKVSNYSFKHIAPKNIGWGKIVESTKKGASKFSKNVDYESLTKKAWDNGTEVNNGKPWKVYKSDDVIGASAGKETKYMRVELTTGTNELHSSPITKEQYYKLIK